MMPCHEQKKAQKGYLSMAGSDGHRFATGEWPPVANRPNIGCEWHVEPYRDFREEKRFRSEGHDLFKRYSRSNTIIKLHSTLDPYYKSVECTVPT